jgi:hypothetical protein
MTVEHSSTITSSLRTAESSVTTGSITVISITVTLTTAISAITTLTTAALTTVTTATRFTEVLAFTLNQERTPARSVALITAEMSEAFPPAGTPALGVAASMVAVPMVVAEGTR